MDEGAFGIAGAIGDAPAQGFVGAGQDFGLAGKVLFFDDIGNIRVSG